MTHLSLMFPVRRFTLLKSSLVANLISSTTFVRSSLEMGTSHVITEFSVRTKMSITIFAIIGRVHHLGVVLPTKLRHNLGLRSFNKINKIVQQY